MITDDIAKLAEIMTTNELTKLTLTEEGTKLKLERGGAVEAGSAQPIMVTHAGHVAPPVPQVPTPAASSAAAEEEVPVESGPVISSPIVGTFYTAPSPEAEPFVKVGDTVGVDTVVCIIEAMKVMNEIKAEMSGVVKRILVDNAQPVEYGQPLFEIETTT